MKKILWGLVAVVVVVIIIIAIAALPKNKPMLIGGSECQAGDAVSTISLYPGDDTTPPYASPNPACVYSGVAITWTSPSGGSWSVCFSEPQVVTAVNGEQTSNPFQCVIQSVAPATGADSSGQGTLNESYVYYGDHSYDVTYQGSSHLGAKPMKIIIMPTGSLKQLLDRLLYVLKKKLL